jgi:hypothetical protein
MGGMRIRPALRDPRRPRRLAGLLAVLALLAPSCDALGGGDSVPTDSPGRLPAPGTRTAGPGEPPIVWIAGSLEEISDGILAVREGNGPRVTLQRLGGGATTFLRTEGGSWHEMSEEEVDALEVGARACVEAFLDARTLVALRVFLGARCGPA